MEGLFDGAVLPVRYGHENFGQVVGGAELQRFAARQSVRWLVAHNVLDHVGGARAATLNQGFEFRDSLVLRLDGCEHEMVSPEMKFGWTVRAKWQQETDAESPTALVDRGVDVGTVARLGETVIAAPRTRASVMF